MKLARLTERLEDFGDSLISIRHADGTLLRRTFRAVSKDLRRARDCLSRLGLHRGHRVGLYAGNAYEWLLLDLACVELGIFLVAFSDETFAARERDAIFAHYGLALLFCDKAMDSTPQHPVLPLTEILREAPASAPLIRVPPRPLPADYFSLSFSSGSTGRPKGSIVSRAGTEFLVTAFVRAFAVTAGDSLLLFLPLSNFQQRLLVYAALYSGASIAITTHEYLFDDWQRFAPSFLVAPPVLFKNILKFFNLQRDGGDSLRALLGGNLRFALVGMAPIEAEVIRAFHAEGILLLEVYCLSEAGTIAWNTPEQFRIGTVGRPLNAEELLFSDEQELLLRRTTPLCLGYYEAAADNPNQVTRTFHTDGVIATGDLARLDADGYLILTGRKKNIVITASGHKFQPEPIERRIDLFEGVNCTVLYHSQALQQNVAIINTGAGPDAPTPAALKEQLARLNESLPDHQRVAKILVNADSYTVDNKLRTSNLKLNRNAIVETYGIF